MTKTATQNKELKQVLGIIGDKWSALLLHDLSQKGPMRFGQCQKNEGINPRTLTQRLLALEKAGLVKRTEFNEYPPRTEYSITPKGKELVPVFDQMVKWAEKHL